MEEKCGNFHEYLRLSGVIDALNNAITKLYDLPQRPEKPLEFLCKNLVPNGEDDTIITDATAKKLIDALASIQILRNGRDLDGNDLKSIEKAIKELQADESCTSLLKKNLTSKEYFDKIDKKQHQLLFDCVKIGLVDHRQDVGLIAADVDCYSTFASLFDPIIKEIHGELPHDPIKPSWDFNVKELVNPKLDHKFIQRAVITCRRSLQKSPFQVRMTSEKDFSDVCQSIITYLEDKFQEPDLRNQIYKFESMQAAEKAELLEQRLIFDESEFDEALEFVGAAKYWAEGRAAYVAGDKSYVIWVNRIDHLEFKSFDNDILKAIERITTIGKIIDENKNLLLDDKYGWLNSSPKYIGNAMTVSIFIKLTKLSGKALDEILDQHKLIINSKEVNKEGSMIYEIQNKSSLCTQFETIKNVLHGIDDIIKQEEK